MFSIDLTVLSVYPLYCGPDCIEEFVAKWVVVVFVGDVGLVGGKGFPSDSEIVFL